eukprot:scaffold187987_cov28-Tisochrysis_lutea.AAC.1
MNSREIHIRHPTRELPRCFVGGRSAYARLVGIRLVEPALLNRAHSELFTLPRHMMPICHQTACGSLMPHAAQKGS